jgi:hypothetical protein
METARNFERRIVFETIDSIVAVARIIIEQNILASVDNFIVACAAVYRDAVALYVANVIVIPSPPTIEALEPSLTISSLPAPPKMELFVPSL